MRVGRRSLMPDGLGEKRLPLFLKGGPGAQGGLSQKLPRPVFFRRKPTGGEVP